jgi:Lamin Tail Domain
MGTFNKICMSFLKVFFPIVAIVILISGCETVDIEPVVQVSVDSVINNRVRENGGLARVRATLNGKSKKEVRLTFGFTGVAQSGVDFTLSSTSIVIPEGQTSGYLDLRAINNNVASGDKALIITLLGASNAQAANEPISLTISDDDIDTDSDGIVDADDSCPLDSGSISTNGCPIGFGLIFNEVLYDPSNAGLEGDANRDGVYGQNQDEFVEIYNTATYDQDISGFTISKFVISTGSTEIRHIFPSGSIVKAGKVLIVFGGGVPTGSFGGSPVQVCSNPSGIVMANSGERVLLTNATNKVIVIFDSDSFSDNPNESYTRSPDITGTFLQHSTVQVGVNFSPGTKTNGTNF